MTTKRATLRERNAAAIADIPTPPQPAAAEPAREQPASVATERPVHDRTPSTTDKTVLSITVRPEDLEEAKSAYIADWLREGRYDGFPKWLGGAIRRHAALTVNERAAIEADRPSKTTSRGLKRAFQMDPGDVDELRAAVRRDLEEGGRLLSEADWVGDAVREAIAAARSRAGGVLPAAPKRLPNRMPTR